CRGIDPSRLRDPIRIVIDDGYPHTRHAAEHPYVLGAPVPVAHHRHADVGFEGRETSRFAASEVSCGLSGTCNELHRDGPPAVARDACRLRIVARCIRKMSPATPEPALGQPNSACYYGGGFAPPHSAYIYDPPPVVTWLQQHRRLSPKWRNRGVSVCWPR